MKTDLRRNIILARYWIGVARSGEGGNNVVLGWVGDTVGNGVVHPRLGELVK